MPRRCAVQRFGRLVFFLLGLLSTIGIAEACIDSRSGPMPTCERPKVAVGENLVIVQSGNISQFSNILLTDPNATPNRGSRSLATRHTRAFNIQIDEIDGPITLVLGNSHPTIFSINGNVDSVERVIAFGSQGAGDGYVGVHGIDPQRLEFVSVSGVDRYRTTNCSAPPKACFPSQFFKQRESSNAVTLGDQRLGQFRELLMGYGPYTDRIPSELMTYTGSAIGVRLHQEGDTLVATTEEYLSDFSHYSQTVSQISKKVKTKFLRAILRAEESRLDNVLFLLNSEEYYFAQYHPEIVALRSDEIMSPLATSETQVDYAWHGLRELQRRGNVLLPDDVEFEKTYEHYVEDSPIWSSKVMPAIDAVLVDQVPSLPRGLNVKESNIGGRHFVVLIAKNVQAPNTGSNIPAGICYLFEELGDDAHECNFDGITKPNEPPPESVKEFLELKYQRRTK